MYIYILNISLAFCLSISAFSGVHHAQVQFSVLIFVLYLKDIEGLLTARLNLILVSGVSGVFWHHGVHFWVLAASLLALCSSKWLYKVEASL